MADQVLPKVAAAMTGNQEGITLTFGQRERSLLCRLNQMRNNGELCDVTIIVEDQQFRCHKVVLAAFSSYFQSLFDVLNRKGFVVAVSVRLSDGDKNLKASAFAQLLDYLYTGSVRVTKQSAANIMHAANGRYFNFEEVKQACIKLLQNTGTTADNGTCTIVQNSGTLAGNGTIVQNLGTVARNGTSTGDGTIVQNSGTLAGNGTIVQNSETQAGNGTIVQNLGTVAGNGTIVQNSGAQSENGTIVQNLGKLMQAGNGTIVHNSGAQARNGAIVQNSGTQAGNGTIVQNSGAQAGNGTIVQNSRAQAGNGTTVQNSGTMQEKCTIPQNSQMPTEKCTIPQNLRIVARILQDLGTMAKNGATLQNSEKMAGNGATLPNSATMERNSQGEEADALACRCNNIIQKTVSSNSNDDVHGKESLHGGATCKTADKQSEMQAADSSQSAPPHNASVLKLHKEKEKVSTCEEACKPLSKTFESHSMQDTSSDDNNVSSSCTKVKVKEEVQEFPCFSQLPWTHDVQKKVLDADVYPFESNPKGIKAREEDLNQFLLNELEMELGGIPTMEDLDEDPIVSTSGWMEEDPDCSEGERSEVRSTIDSDTDCGDSEGGRRKRKWSEEMFQGKKRSKRDIDSEASAAHTSDGSSLDSLSPANYYPLFMSRQPSAESKIPGSSPVRKDLERSKMPSNPIMFFGDFGTTLDTNLQGTVRVDKPTNMQMAVMSKRGVFPHSQNAQLKTVHNPSTGVKTRSVFLSFGDSVVARDLEVTQTSRPT